MKKIYVVLTHTGTILSRITKSYTKDEFSHCSISLDIQLNQMYSFGRLKAYNPFIGGFVHESTNHGTFKRFKNTTTCIFSVDVEEEEYETIKQTIKEFKRQRRIYKFNIIGLFAVAIHLKLRFKNSFYCAEFVKEVLQRANVAPDLPKIIKPEDFRKMENISVIYQGMLKDYSIRDSA